MEAWSNFSLGELGAAAALAGLLFVGISVNLDRIVELGRMADRGLEALVMLFLVVVAMSLTLMPGQPTRLLGAEIAMAGLAAMAVIVLLQRGYLRHLDPVYRPRSTRVAWVNRAAVGVVAFAGLLLAWRGGDAGLYLLAAGILLCFLGAGINAWVLLIEIKR